MTEQILKKLKAIELEHDVKILYAVESGSRAWGFASPDSDYDVRFIYARHPDHYTGIKAEIEKQGDTIECKLDQHNIDASGWDIRKAFMLLYKSNPPLLEWLQSPIVYKDEGDLGFTMRLYAKNYASPKSMMYHYLHMASGNSKDELYIGKDREQVKLKKYFYVLRPLLACQWIAARGKAPPTEFAQVLDAGTMHSAVRIAIHDLLERKKRAGELTVGPSVKVLDDFIVEQLDFYKEFVKGISEPAPSKKLDVLNAMLIQVMRDTWEVRPGVVAD